MADARVRERAERFAPPPSRAAAASSELREQMAAVEARQGAAAAAHAAAAIVAAAIVGHQGEGTTRDSGDSAGTARDNSGQRDNGTRGNLWSETMFHER